MQKSSGGVRTGASVQGFPRQCKTSVLILIYGKPLEAFKEAIVFQAKRMMLAAVLKIIRMGERIIEERSGSNLL